MATKKAATKKPVKKPAVKESKEIIPMSDVVHDLVINGDIGNMTPEQKVRYYNGLCKSLGLNPLTQPFQLIKLQGREILYASKSCTEQLRKINGISVEKIDHKIESELSITIVSVKDKSGRVDGATGAVSIKGLSGDALANAIMKSETKAKRRATLSISGLGFLDETEIETIPGAVTAKISLDVTPQKADDPKPVDDSERAENLIESAQNVKHLVARGYEIKAMSIPPEKREHLAGLYKRRMDELTEPRRNG